MDLNEEGHVKMGKIKIFTRVMKKVNALSRIIFLFQTLLWQKDAFKFI